MFPDDRGNRGRIFENLVSDAENIEKESLPPSMVRYNTTSALLSISWVEMQPNIVEQTAVRRQISRCRSDKLPA